MCTTQLVKLQRRIDEFTAEGAAVFAVSIDKLDQARKVAQEFKLGFPILSDPEMQVIRPSGMKGDRMEMAELAGIRWLSRSEGAFQGGRASDRAPEMRRERYARGEISGEEFHRIRQDLSPGARS